MPKESKRRRPRQRRAKATVDAIVEAAAQIVRAEGAEAITTNHVADVAGVSVGTLYQYFGSKQDIYVALHEREFDKLSTYVGKALIDSAGGTLDDLVVAVLDAVLQSRASDAELHRLLAHTVPRRQDTKPEVERLAAAFGMAVAARKSELREQIDLRLFVYTLGNLVSGVTSSAALSWRPAAISGDAARAEAIRAIRAYIDTCRAED